MNTPATRREYHASRASARPAPKAGRNLPAAIGVGVALGALVIATLVIRKEAFLVVITVAAGIGVWELTEGVRQGRVHPPRIPALLGAIGMVPAAYFGGAQALAVGFALTCIGILVWRAVDGLDDAVRDIAGGVFVTAYVPLLAGFAALLLVEPDGVQRVFVFLIVTISSDVGGYVVGVLAGRHPLAPSVSPKKSWEGLAGSAACCVVGGIACVVLLLSGPWWAGAVLGLAVVVAATVGDLSESTIKRDLGIKDMGSLLPGHGGLMDRLDSLLIAAPVAWALLTVFVPVG